NVRAYLTVTFFFQAEDGIRDDLVTGVQTCALPISDLRIVGTHRRGNHHDVRAADLFGAMAFVDRGAQVAQPLGDDRRLQVGAGEIGRASCRERGGMWVVAVEGGEQGGVSVIYEA